MSVSFWLKDPTVLFDNTMILELYPNKNMSSSQKLNAITRLVILLTLLAYAFTKRETFLLSGFLTLIGIVVFWNYKVKTEQENIKEGLTERCNKENLMNLVNNDSENNNQQNQTKPTKENPLMNVMITDYVDNPNKKPALNGYEDNVEHEINEKTKDFVAEQFDNDPKIKEMLFNDLSESVEFTQSMRQFHVNPATTIPNDQDAFAKFCYGGAPSCKDNNSLACEKNAFRKYPGY